MQISIDKTGSEPFQRKRLNRWQILFIVFIAIGITVSEYIFAYRNVADGIVIALVLTIFIYLMISIFNFDSRITDCSESLALIPLYILFTASLPWFFINQQYLLPAVYSLILALCLWHIYQKQLNLKAIFNFHKGKLLKHALIGIALGIPMGTVEYLVLRVAPSFPTFEVRYFLRDTVYMLVFVGIGEELLFRGLIQTDLMASFGVKWGLLGQAFLFAVMHLTWRSVPELGFVFVAALVLGGLYYKTKSLTASIVMHGVNNIILVAVAPYLLHLS